MPHVQSVFGGVEQVMSITLAEGDGRFVAVGIEGTFPLASSDGVAWTSQDGLSWTRSNPGGLAGPEDEFLTRVVFGPMGFVAVGAVLPTGTGRENIVGPSAVWTSPDGGEWTRVPHDDAVFGSPDGFQTMLDVTRGGPGLVAVGAVGDFSAGGVWTSPDGMSWTRVADDPEAFRPRLGWYPQMLGVASAADGQRLVAVGHDTGPGTSQGSVRKAAAVWVSLDSVSWTRVPHDDAVFGDSESVVQMDGVVAGGPGFVAVGVEAGAEQLDEVALLPWPNELLGRRAQVNSDGSMRAAIWTSPDGLAWTRVPDAQLPDTGDEKVRLYEVTTGGPGLVAVGVRVSAEELDAAVWTSPDGETWSVATDLEEALRGQGGQFMADVIAGGPGLIAVGGDGVAFGFNTAIWTSP